jgi:hypothetical protein
MPPIISASQPGRQLRPPRPEDQEEHPRVAVQPEQPERRRVSLPVNAKALNIFLTSPLLQAGQRTCCEPDERKSSSKRVWQSLQENSKIGIGTQPLVIISGRIFQHFILDYEGEVPIIVAD